MRSILCSTQPLPCPRLKGTPVRYSKAVQLVHELSGALLCIDAYERTASKGFSLKVVLKYAELSKGEPSLGKTASRLPRGTAAVHRSGVNRLGDLPSAMEERFGGDRMPETSQPTSRWGRSAAASPSGGAGMGCTPGT